MRKDKPVMQEISVDRVRALAQYLTGPMVAHFSVLANLTHPWAVHHRESSAAFFALRKAFGIEGYANTEEAQLSILTPPLPSKSRCKAR